MKDYAPLFFEYFRGFERGKGVFTVKGIEANGKVFGKAETLRTGPTLTDWELHLAGKQGIGIVPIMADDCCYFGALDIDDRGIDHVGLEKACENLPVCIARSKSGGAHVYVFFNEPVPAELVQRKLSEWAAMLGVGGCEIFPKQNKRSSENDVGNWLNMPYFGGDGSDRRMYYQGKLIPLSVAVELIKSCRINKAQFEGITCVAKTELFQDGPPCLKFLFTKGIPAGMRNQSMYNAGVYFKKKNPDGYAEDMMRLNSENVNPPLELKELQTIAKSVAKKDYGYKCKEQPICNHCNRKACLTMKYGVGNGGGHDGGANVQIGNLTKIETNPPIWIIDIEGERVEVPTSTLLSQKEFQQVCVERIHKFPVTINATRWQNKMNDLLRTAETIPAPPDASIEGQFMSYIDMFLTERPISKVKEEILIGRAFHHIEKKEIWFRSQDLQKYLDTKKFSKNTPDKVWSLLRKIGAGDDRQRIGHKIVSIWTLPDSLLPENEENVLPIPEGISNAS